MNPLFLLPLLIASAFAEVNDGTNISLYSSGFNNDSAILFTTYVSLENLEEFPKSGTWLLTSVGFEATSGNDWEAEKVVGQLDRYSEQTLTFENNGANDGPNSVLTLSKPLAIGENDMLVVYQYDKITKQADSYVTNIKLYFMRSDSSETFEFDYDTVHAYEMEGDVFYTYYDYTSYYSSTIYYGSSLYNTFSDINAVETSGDTGAASSTSASSPSSTSNSAETTTLHSTTSSSSSSSASSTGSSSTSASSALAIIGKAIDGSAVFSLACSVLFFFF